MVGSNSIHLTISHIGKVVKLQDSPCKRIILIAPGWPNMPWFWDLVAMSSHIPLSLPNLSSLFTAIRSDPSQKSDNLNLHAGLLEPQQSRSRTCLRQWQQELRLLKGGSIRSVYETNGSFLPSDVSFIRWTSGTTCKVSCLLP